MNENGAGTNRCVFFNSIRKANRSLFLQWRIVTGDKKYTIVLRNTRDARCRRSFLRDCDVLNRACNGNGDVAVIRCTFSPSWSTCNYDCPSQSDTCLWYLGLFQCFRRKAFTFKSDILKWTWTYCAYSSIYFRKITFRK